jgi:hypothetical protein
MVGAHKASDVGQQVYICPGISIQSQFASLDLQCPADRWHEGRQNKLSNRQAQEEVVHSGIAHDHCLQNLLRFGTGLSAQVNAKLVDGVNCQFL